MNDHAPSARAWPFLVARGRHRGYRTLLAPDFLVAERDYGVLDDEVVPSTREDQASVIDVVTGAGHPLTVVHATHLVTSADIAEPGGEPAGHAPRDEHSRPLQLIYGFVCAYGAVTAPHVENRAVTAPLDQDGAVISPLDEDLRVCLAASLAAYRRFLGDEDAFEVEAGREFQARSLVVRPPVPSRQPVRALSMTGPAAMTGDETIGHGTPRPVVRRGGVLLAAAVVLIAVILSVVWLVRPKAPADCDAQAPTGASQLQQLPGHPEPTPTPSTICGPGREQKTLQQKTGNKPAATG
jgi:hypothetical protein